MGWVRGVRFGGTVAFWKKLRKNFKATVAIWLGAGRALAN